MLPSSHRLGFRCRLAEDVGGYFFDGHAELEHRYFGSASPARYFPVRTNKLHVWMRAEIQQQRSLAAIELLREFGEGLWVPHGTVGGADDADVERFLLDNFRNLKGYEKDPVGGFTHVDGRAV